MAIQLNEERRKFYDAPSGRFKVEDIPPEVFGRLNVHAQKRLLGGSDLSLNPGFYKASIDKPTAPSLLGAGPVAPGQMTQPANVVAQYNPPTPSPSRGGVPQTVQTPVYPETDYRSGYLGQPTMQTLELETPIAPQSPLGSSQPIGGTQPTTGDKRFDQTSPRGMGTPIMTPFGVGYMTDYGSLQADTLNDLLGQAGSHLLSSQFMKTGIASDLGLTAMYDMSSGIPNVALNYANQQALTQAYISQGMAPEAAKQVAAQEIASQSATYSAGSLLSGASAGYLGYTLSELITGEMGYFEQDSTGEVGAAAGGTIGFIAGGPIGAGIGAFLGGTAGTIMGGEKLHAGEQSVGSTFYGLQGQDNLFPGDQNANFAKNMALARLANPNAGADSISDALRGMGNRVINEPDVDSQTVMGFQQLVKEGYLTKQEILDGIQLDLELFRKDVEAIKEPIKSQPIAKPDTLLSFPELTPAPQAPTMPVEPKAENIKPKPTPKPKPKTASTTQTSPSGISSEPVIFIPSLGKSITLSELSNMQ